MTNNITIVIALVCPVCLHSSLWGNGTGIWFNQIKDAGCTVCGSDYRITTYVEEKYYSSHESGRKPDFNGFTSKSGHSYNGFQGTSEAFELFGLQYPTDNDIEWYK